MAGSPMIPLRRFALPALTTAVRLSPMCDEKVTFAWQLVVGPAVAKATTVRLDDQGVLHVTAADRHWHREVRRSAALIRTRLDVLLGEGVVTRIATL